MRAGGLLGPLLAACLAAGCPSTSSGPPPSGTPTPAPLAAREQPLFTATISDPKTFNPITRRRRSRRNVAIGELFDALVRLNPRTTEMEPALAERWEHNADGTVCTFHLRHDVRWHDGQPFTAADVVFTFDAIFDEHVPNSLKHVLTVDGQPIKVEARRRLHRAHAPAAAVRAAAQLDRHRRSCRSTSSATRSPTGTFAQQWGIDTPPEKLIGTGPYRMTTLRAGAVHRATSATRDYWMKDDARQAAALSRVADASASCRTRTRCI